jgi:quinolinate synthase
MESNNYIQKIQKLKQEKNAIILVHNYQRPEIQDIADYVGDSFGLAKQAMETDADIIVFCGVDFMAESAKILNPDKLVVHPDFNAQCPMAGMVDVESLKWMKEKHSDAAVVSYVNTSAEVKTESDICVTSSNAVNIIKNLDYDTIIFIPDTNLGNYVKRFISEKDIILWPGICPTHHKIKQNHILNLKRKHPQAEILVHPECNPDVIDIADHVFSTQGIINHVGRSISKEFIIGTEKELCYRLKVLYPEKKYYPVDHAVCPNMKKITIKKVYESLKSEEPVVILSDEVIKKALIPLQKMVDIGRND